MNPFAMMNPFAGMTGGQGFLEQLLRNPHVAQMAAGGPGDPGGIPSLAKLAPGEIPGQSVITQGMQIPGQVNLPPMPTPQVSEDFDFMRFLQSGGLDSLSGAGQQEAMGPSALSVQQPPIQSSPFQMPQVVNPFQGGLF